MTVADWLTAAQQQLTAADVQTARLDALVLLEDALGQDRAWLLAHPETELTASQQTVLADQLQRRERHEPLAYLRGHVEFYGRDFYVNEHVLVPRPESEAIIDLLKKLSVKPRLIADIGSGSGALAITAALETGAVAAAVDIDEACLAVVQRNAVMHTTPIITYQGDVLGPFLGKNADRQPDVILANLPYVPTDYPINQAAQHEPALALYGGADDGLDLYRHMFTQAQQLVTTPTIITEALPEQHAALLSIAEQAGFTLIASQDFAQRFDFGGSTTAV